MINSDLLSVVTVSYNSSKTIGKTIKSVLNQSIKNFEYIIVYGNSTDNTLEIIKSFNDKFKQKGIEVEMSIEELYQDEMLYLDMLLYMKKLGFELCSLENGFYDQNSGKLLQVDGIFFKTNTSLNG
ncbi:glycosyltransferase [Polaribacter aquimarinus]|uniref:Glycosyltransferase 2-like domain-containing protein n=1 Tax=Polaribacter aquimarinus TaxID=2100726 RepID=A0A2U2JBA5_9FLAO|nr:glycosyltransferase [Polaribacter aquimarinus]PWG05602.1 hypothetical protein DIS07_03930 [Polaribacter aquimarinus]